MSKSEFEIIVDCYLDRLEEEAPEEKCRQMIWCSIDEAMLNIRSIQFPVINYYNSSRSSGKYYSVLWLSWIRMR